MHFFSNHAFLKLLRTTVANKGPKYLSLVYLIPGGSPDTKILVLICLISFKSRSPKLLGV